MVFDDMWLVAKLAQGHVRVVPGTGDVSGSEGLSSPTPPAAISHKAFQAAVVRLATAHGWKAHFTVNSRKSPPGFPDLVLAKPNEPVIYAELKIPPDTLSIEQEQWLKVLSLACNTETYVWRPEDWSQIDARLTQPWRPGTL